MEVLYERSCSVKGAAQMHKQKINDLLNRQFFVKTYFLNFGINEIFYSNEINTFFFQNQLYHFIHPPTPSHT